MMSCSFLSASIHCSLMLEYEDSRVRYDVLSGVPMSLLCEHLATPCSDVLQESLLRL